MRLLLFMFALAGTGLDAATLTARLRPATVNLGNSTTLTLVCDASANTVDPVSTPEYLGLSFVTLKRDTVILNGDRRNETQFVYKITPKRVGRYAVPAFKTRINDQEIRSEPVTLTVLTADGSNNNLSLIHI